MADLSPSLERHSPSEGATPQHKNIVICCDGTGNEFGDANSNVVKLYTALAIDNQQVGYYHPGVGTMGDPGERHAVLRFLSKVEGLAFGQGFKDNVFDAYRYLMETYNDGDKVYLFGFSRGGYTVRALAGLLDGYGLLCRGNQGHLPYAWRLYANQHHDRSRHHIHPGDCAAQAFKETFSHRNFSLHFVGVWDTVSSIGWIYSPMRLFNVAQNATIHHGRQAISIDERRCFYQDNLWGTPLPNQDLKQVWFAGVHSDVGGSYSQSTSGLSNLALRWMLDEAKTAGLRLVACREQMLFGAACADDPHASELYPVPKTSDPHRSLRGWWWPLEFLPHIHYDKDQGREYRRIPLGRRRTIPAGSLIHPSVIAKLQSAGGEYRPGNLDPRNLTPPLTAGTPAANSPAVYTYNPPEEPTHPRLEQTLALVVGVVELAIVIAIGLFVVYWLGRGVAGFWHLVLWAFACLAGKAGKVFHPLWNVIHQWFVRI